MNILQTPLGRYAPGIINVVVEVPKGSKKKYRYHRKKRAFVVDYRLMIPAPTEYGWVPQTLTPVGRRLDAMVLVRKPSWAGNVSEVRPIGALRRYDLDHKLICVLLGEPRFEAIQDLSDLDATTARKIVQFFEPFFPVQGWLNRRAALEFIAEAHQTYKRRLRLRELTPYDLHEEEAEDDIAGEYDDYEDAEEDEEAQDLEEPVAPPPRPERPGPDVEAASESVLTELPEQHEV
jgi:inorganic pyrophosphatase